MAGIPSGGQNLTPNNNVNAPAGVGGDKWGKFGGGIAAVGTGKPIASTLSDGETCRNYQTVPGGPFSLSEQINDGQLDQQTLDSSIPSGNSTQG